MVLIISGLVYLTGYILAFIMQRTELAADKEIYTIGNRLLMLSLSILSFLFVLIMLIRSWVKMIETTGYWNKPVAPVVEEIEIKSPKAKKQQLN